ncbi:MAG: hypothetical protein O3A00_26730, partial [Planctomycetota bacterium]|nr:hypothetical protein [Planctomycetota bacterium]
TAGTVQLGDANSGAITVSSAITHPNDLALTTGAGVTFNNVVTLAMDKSLTANAVGTINLPNANADLSATGSGAISLTTARDFAMFTASGWSIKTQDGDITLNANQQASRTAGDFYGLQANGGLIEATGGGAIVINARGCIGGVSNAGVAIDPNTTVRTNTGSITMVGVGAIDGGAGNQDNGLQVHNGSTVESTGGGSIDLTGTAGTFGVGIRVLFNGVVRTTGAGAITLTGTGGGSVPAIAANNINYGVSVDLGTNASGNAVSNSGNGTITINATAGNNREAFFTGRGGTNRIGFDGTNAYSGDIIINADSMSIDDATIETTGSVTLNQKTNGTLINLGGADVLTSNPLTLGLTDAELDQITAGTLNIGDSNSGTITVSADITRAANTNVNLTTGSGNNIAFGAFSLNAGSGGDVTLTTSGSGAITTSNNSGTDLTADDVTLTAGSNGIGSTTNFLRLAATTIAATTSGNGSINLVEADSVNIGANDLDAGSGTITLGGGTFLTTATGSLLSAVTVQSGATLGGSGTVGDSVTINDGGSLAPGSSTAKLTVDGNVTFADGSRFDAEINGLTAGTQYDQLIVTGASRTVNLGNARLGLSGSFVPEPGDAFTLVELVDASSTLSGTFLDLAEGQLVTVGGTSSQISYAGNDAVLSTRFLIGNRVFEDRNGNGLHDPGEPGVADVTVRLLDAVGTTTLATTTTSADGTYAFRPASLGTYTVEFVKPAGFNFTSPNQGTDTRIDSNADPTTGRASVTLSSANQLDVTIDAGLSVETTLAAISDTVFRDDNSNGVQDSGEPGLPDVTVRLLNSALATINTDTTDANGHYDFQGLLAGTYFVEFDLLAGFEFSAKDQGGDDARDSDANPSTGRTDAIALTAQQKRIDVDAGMQRRSDLGAIGDRVWRDLNANGIQDAGEPGLNGVAVELTDSASQTTRQTTASGGRYLFEGLSAGTYDVRVVAPAGLEFTVQDAGINDAADSDVSPSTGRVSVTLATNENILTVDAGLKPIPSTSTIGGEVWQDVNANGLRDRFEIGLGNVTVTLLDSTGSEQRGTTTTLADGTYRFGSLPAATYVVRFTPAGGLIFTTKDAGTDDSIDSDAELDNGEAIVTVAAD